MVRDREVHREVIQKIRDFALENGFSVLNLDYSPVKGPEGNIEYLIYLEKSEQAEDLQKITPEQVVDRAHEALD